MLASKFIETELAAYITEHRLTAPQDLIKIIGKAFEAYDEYKKLMSGDASLNYVTDTKFNVRDEYSKELVEYVKQYGRDNLCKL